MNILYKKSSYIVISLLCIITAYSVLIFCSNETIIILGNEDGIFETSTAIWFIMAAIIFLYLFLKDNLGNNLFGLKTKKNIFFLLLGILLIFGAGEETSWGQRTFNLQTPERLSSTNRQGEINIHNLPFFHGINPDGSRKTGLTRMVTMDRLFAFFWFFYCFIIPVINIFSSKFSGWLRFLNLPVISIWIGLLFILNHLIFKLAELTLTASDSINHSMVEIKEHNFAFLFFIVGLFFIRNYRGNIVFNKPDKAST